MNCNSNCFGGNCWWIIILLLLFCCCGNGTADHGQNRVNCWINCECNQSCQRSNGQCTEDQVQTGWQIFFNVWGNKTDNVTCNETWQDSVTAAGKTAYYCKYWICTHADWNHNACCNAAEAACGCANFTEECNTQKITSDVFVYCFYQERCNSCICHTGHCFASLRKL